MAVTILIVEDELILAMDLEDMLTRAGFAVIGNAVDMYEAVNLAERHAKEIDVAIMDVHLASGTNGVETARVLRQRWGIPSLFVSGNLDEETRRLAAVLEPIGFIGKPFAEKEVLRLISSVTTQNSA